MWRGPAQCGGGILGTASADSFFEAGAWDVGADEGNRTLVVSLGSSCSTIELHPPSRAGFWHTGGPVASCCGLHFSVAVAATSPGGQPDNGAGLFGCAKCAKLKLGFRRSRLSMSGAGGANLGFAAQDIRRRNAHSEGNQRVIRIDSHPAPGVLEAPFMRDRRAELFAYLRRPEPQRSQRRAPIAEEVFYGGELPRAVAERCRGKCAFCECEVADARVEHFRPVRVDEFDAGHEGDHYAWLAYEWNNMMLVCVDCAAAKRDLFPVKGARAPRLASFDEVRRVETALLIDPYHETPDRYFDFLLDGRCAPLKPRGRITASVLDLDGERLRDLRRKDLAELQADISSWASDGDHHRLKEAFDLRRPFIGARLNVLKRVLNTLPWAEAIAHGPMRYLPTKMDGYIAGRREDRRQVPEQFEALAKVDQAREIRTAPDYANEAYEVVPEDRGAFARYTKPRRVGRIAVRNLKGIRTLVIEGPPGRRTRRGAPCLMLLGENATGKSTILQGIALALLGGPQARRLRLDPDDFLRSGPKNRWDQLEPESAEVEVAFLFREGGAIFELDGPRRRILGRQPPETLVMGYGPRRYFDPRQSTPPTHPYACVRTLFDPRATIPYPGGWLNGLLDHEFDSVARALRPILALSDTDELVRDIDGRISVVVEDRPVPIERLSEGYRSVFALAADIFREMLAHFHNLESAHGVVLIDEIETHLHPRWKMQVMSALRRALPNVQFIVTTHDPLCLRGMDDGEVVVLQRNTEGEIVLLQDLPSLKGMRAEQLLTSDYFGLSSTIDPETELEVARFAADVTARPDEHVTSEAVSRLTLGDSAGEQVIQAALQRFLDAREKPAGALRPDVRAEAVEAVYKALAAAPAGSNEPSEGNPA